MDGLCCKFREESVLVLPSSTSISKPPGGVYALLESFQRFHAGLPVSSRRWKRTLMPNRCQFLRKLLPSRRRTSDLRPVPWASTALQSLTVVLFSHGHFLCTFPVSSPSSCLFWGPLSGSPFSTQRCCSSPAHLTCSSNWTPFTPGVMGDLLRQLCPPEPAYLGPTWMQ